MKVRESGMPEQEFWESLFDVPCILDAFGFGAHTGDVAELGCGYGTFSIPLAQRISGTLHTVDIDPVMVELTRRRAAGLKNLLASARDVLVDGFGVAAGSCDACLLFNILHAEDPVALLQAARTTVHDGGLVAVIHWRSDVPTPRGPPLAIRPTPESILGCAADAQLAAEADAFVLPPWHFGMKLRPKPGAR